jgi:hypothetical protein
MSNPKIKPWEDGADLAFMRDPSQWPLPGQATALKRYSEGQRTQSATLLFNEGTYYLMPLALPIFITGVRNDLDLPEPLPVTPEQLIEDGWIVD